MKTKKQYVTFKKMPKVPKTRISTVAWKERTPNNLPYGRVMRDRDGSYWVVSRGNTEHRKVWTEYDGALTKKTECRCTIQ